MMEDQAHELLLKYFREKEIVENDDDNDEEFEWDWDAIEDALNLVGYTEQAARDNGNCGCKYCRADQYGEDHRPPPVPEPAHLLEFDPV